jgi:ribonuclease P protein component
MKKSLSKHDLLRKKKEIKQLFLSSQQYSCRGMKMFLFQNSIESNRVLVTLVRGFGNAVERNYTRRVVKELFRLNRQQLQSGIDYGFLMYPGAYTFKDREQQLLSLLQRQQSVPQKMEKRSTNG